ncbi:MAG: tyrosine-type recombinase/integrase [Actinomycetota bacterium]|jgi:site-specific recombinase XerD|nr:tyrosine-type recombinase/integrase [Actinomycetota bacterium]
MSELARQAEDYLRLRRSLGFKLTLHGRVLPQFVDYLDAAGATTVTTELAVSFAQLPQGVQPVQWAHRLSMVRGFARYLQAIDPETEVPPHDVFGARYQRPTPYLWQESEVLDLMAAARQLRPELCALTYECFFGLLWSSGMRIGETVGLQRDDVDLTRGVITVRQAKLGRSRLVPLQQSSTDALASYAAGRDRLCPRPSSQAFFVSSRGTTLVPQLVLQVFHRLAVKTGLRTGTKKPRVHDLRHSFAVRVLISWLRAGIDVETRMLALSTYLGHVNPVDTYWYLSISPELVELVAKCLDDGAGGLQL